MFVGNKNWFHYISGSTTKITVQSTGISRSPSLACSRILTKKQGTGYLKSGQFEEVRTVSFEIHRKNSVEGKYYYYCICLLTSGPQAELHRLLLHKPIPQPFRV